VIGWWPLMPARGSNQNESSGGLRSPQPICHVILPQKRKASVLRNAGFLIDAPLRCRELGQAFLMACGRFPSSLRKGLLHVAEYGGSSLGNHNCGFLRRELHEDSLQFSKRFCARFRKSSSAIPRLLIKRPKPGGELL